MSETILVLGKQGQLGRALTALLGKRAHAAGRQEVDLASPDFMAQLERFTGSRNYTAVINAAAYTQVDKAEGEGRNEAFHVNRDAVAVLATWCKARNLPLIHYSTDYVFDGTGSQSRTEEALTSPINVYGQSKQEGEQVVVASGAKYLIFRTSWVYDAQSKNFFNTMLRLFAEKESINVVNDQVGAPTYAPHLAAASLAALKAASAAVQFPSGIYHLTGGGATSWYGFAQAIFTLARSSDSGQKSSFRCISIRPISTSEYPLPARRPFNSRLDCSKAKRVLNVVLPDWEIGLNECFREKYASAPV